jgi:hypothetical protein
MSDIEFGLHRDEGQLFFRVFDNSLDGGGFHLTVPVDEGDVTELVETANHPPTRVDTDE